MNTQAKNPIKATEKSLKIIDALQELEHAGVTELSEHLGLAKPTVHHHVSTLESHEFVTRDGDGYTLGIRFFELGQAIRRQNDIYDIARPEIDTLSADTGEIANLMIEEHGRGVYLYISRGERAIKLDTKIGTRQYLHMSASGKAILANLDDAERAAIVERHGLPAKTPNTVTDREELANELAEIREEGVAYDGEERAEGIRCVAAPIMSQDGTLFGAVSVSGPAARLKGDVFYQEVPEQVKDTASIIAINASYS